LRMRRFAVYFFLRPHPTLPFPGFVIDIFSHTDTRENIVSGHEWFSGVSWVRGEDGVEDGIDSG